MSGWIFPSTERAVIIICTSLRKSCGKSGRNGRSVKRQVSIAPSLARPSRLKNEPGIRPAAYSFSSKSTLSGKKSIPGRAFEDIVAVASNIVSPCLMVTAPPANPANLPVSTIISCPPTLLVNFLCLDIKKTSI